MLLTDLAFIDDKFKKQTIELQRVVLYKGIQTKRMRDK